MAQTIAQSLEILNETMDNSKTALEDKGVTVEDTYKLSDVDEKIGEIEAGGGSGFKFIEYVKFEYQPQWVDSPVSTILTYNAKIDFIAYTLAGINLTAEVKLKDDIDPNIYLHIEFYGFDYAESVGSIHAGDIIKLIGNSNSSGYIQIRGLSTRDDYENYIYFNDYIGIEAAP